MKPLRKLRTGNSFAYLSVSPIVIYLCFILLFPVLWGIFISFTNLKIGSDAEWIGIKNYATLLKDSTFRAAAWNTIKYTVFSIVGKAVLGTLMALLLNLKFKGRNLARALLIIPWTLPNLVAAFNWKWIFSAQGGMLNGILKGLGLIDANINYLGVPALAFMAIVVVNVWRGTPFFGISLLSKMQSIPNELYESAEIDGASRMQKFRYITLPLILDVLILTSLISTIWTINDFETVWLLTGGGPNKATELISIISYKTAIKAFKLGRGASIALFFAPILILLIFFVVRYSSRQNDE